jgi:DNA adenine methylase
MTDTVRRPALRYHGGKWRLAEWIVRHMAMHSTYGEWYCGGASPFFRKWRARLEVINDIDGDIVNVHRVLRDPLQATALAELLALTPYARDEFEAAYESTTCPVERARRTLVRSQMGFGSDSCNVKRRTGFRTTRSTSGVRGREQGTPPALDWSRYPRHVPEFVARLAGAIIENRDAIEVMEEFDGEHTLHYCDPPYPREVRSEARGYRHEYKRKDHIRLAAAVKNLRGMVLVSGYRCELYDDLYARWHRVDKGVVVFRNKRATESLWLNDQAVAALKREGVAIGTNRHRG